jgi:hypothetical protein
MSPSVDAFIPCTAMAPSVPVGPTTRSTGNKSNTIVLLVVGALFLPYTAALYIGDLKLTPIKILILALLLPALSKLFSASGKKRRLLAPDLYALGVFLTMFSSPLTISGSRDFVPAFSQAIEFYGMYLIGRAFIVDDTSVLTLSRSLQFATVIVVAFGILDIVFDRYVVLEQFDWAPAGTNRNLDPSNPQLNRVFLGIRTLRAASTFDHPILFGAFCAAIIPLHLYIPMSPMRRLLLVIVCVTGCLIAVSSGPLLAACMAFAIYSYDVVMNRYPWRWKLLFSSLAVIVLTFSLASNNPLSWLFRNLTVDPQTAYFRLMIWDAGIDVLSTSPLLGIGYNPSGNWIVDASIDSLWLAKSIIYGLPMTTFLYLAPMAAMTPVRGEAAARHYSPPLDWACTAFSMMLAVILFVSITVTFWNAVWLLFAMCIGVRTSLKERCLADRRALRSLERQQRELGWRAGHGAHRRSHPHS